MSIRGNKPAMVEYRYDAPFKFTGQIDKLTTIGAAH
jgi:hypothetical protein